MSEENAKWLTIITLLIGGLGAFALSFACVLDWILKIEQGLDYSVNIIYHPIMALIAVFLFAAGLCLLREKRSPGHFKRIFTEITDYQSIVYIIAFAVGILSLFGLIFYNSPTMITQIAAGNNNPITVIFHLALGLLLGLSLFVGLLKFIILKYSKNPSKFQNFALLTVIVIIFLGIITVLIGRNLGLLALK